MAPKNESEKQMKRYKLVLRVYSAEELQHSSSQGAYCKLYVGSTAMTEGRHTNFNKKDTSDSTTSSEDEKIWHLEVRRTRTQHQQPNALAPPETIWDEVFEVPIRSNRDQILSIRVKSHHLFFCPVIGACAVSLANLCPGERLEQWFPLQKGKKAAGRIRIMLLIVPKEKVLKARRKQPNQDVMAARAANHEADEAIKRLVENQLRQEAERRQRRLHRSSSGPPMEVKRSPLMEHDCCGMDTNVDSDTRQQKEHYTTWPPPPSDLSPHKVPPKDTSFVLKDDKQPEEECPSPPTSEQLHVPVASMSEYEQRLDRKLRQVRKETARLRKLKSQLKKYIPDLQMDSDSEDSFDSEEDSETQLSGTSMSSTCSTSAKVHVKENGLTNTDEIEISRSLEHTKFNSASFDGTKWCQVSQGKSKESAVAF